MLLPEGAWRVGLYTLYRAVDKRARRSSRTLAIPADVRLGKNRGVDPAKGYHSRAHAVVAVSRGGEDAQGEGGIALAFFWSAKTVR